MALRDMSAEDKQSLIQHFEELRKSILYSVVAIIIAAIASFSYSEQILALIVSPLRIVNPSLKLIVTGVTEAFFVKLQLSFLAGFIIAFPVVAWSLWRFIKPALHDHERRYFYVLFPATLLLFGGGVLFAYFGIMPLVLKFFVYIAGQNLETMFKVDQYVSFVMSFTLPFGLVFEMPVVAFFLAKLGIIKYAWMAKHRKHALLVIVIVAAALTPGPDPFSQLMMAGPMFLLYEISIWVTKFSERNRNAKPVLEQ
ncbi:MAG TPA: twin-arginine translocase subunit TatC [Syntrophomonadaceae bacterium]|nr:twin-arginine translocase subunit TatC [Syntrophomonadaceae bacterium]